MIAALSDVTFENLLVEVAGSGDRKTGVIRLNRPKQLNALSDPLMDELGRALLAFDADDGIGCIVLTGSERAFAAGADIPTMAPHTFMSAFKSGLISKNWETILQVRKPVIGAVAGFALGGGCELAMMCDFIIAAETAQFGQPEIKLGIIPGAGGTQRLPRAVSKSKAMDMLLTARMMDAAEAERAGLVSRVVPAEQLMARGAGGGGDDQRLQRPVDDADQGSWSTCAYQGPLTDGVAIERRYFHALFGTDDQREGMEAFLAKRAPAVQASA